MLMKGLAGIDNETRHEAMLVLGRRVFGSQILSGHEKSRAFPLTARKILALYHEDPGRWADVLLPRGHARAALPLHHGAES